MLSLDPMGGCASTCGGAVEAERRPMLSVGQCLAAMKECNTPIVAICGGEPLEYPEIARLTREILERGKHLFLCTDRHADSPATAHDSAVYEFFLEREAGWNGSGPMTDGRCGPVYSWKRWME